LNERVLTVFRFLRLEEVILLALVPGLEALFASSRSKNYTDESSFSFSSMVYLSLLTNVCLGRYFYDKVVVAVVFLFDFFLEIVF